MGDPKEKPDVSGLFQEIGKVKPERVQAAPLDPQLVLLRAWQSDRLAHTYADLMASPRYRPTFQFFLTDIYGARDYSQRNHDIQKMYALLRRFMPEPMIRPLVLTVELHEMTEALDAHLLEVLVHQLGVQDSISTEQYAQAYRLCDNYAERLEQIDLIYEIVYLLDAIVRLPFSGAAVAVAKGPGQRAGWTDLMDFMERGYKAFRQMRDSKPFLETIRSRERQILDRIYAQDPDPFRFEPAALGVAST